MKIYKDISIMQTKYIFDIILENGVVLHTMEDGSADGSDGCHYYAVSEIVNGEVVVLGWSKDTDKPLHLEEQESM